MTCRVILEDMTNTGFLGIQCDQCHACFPFVSGAVMHQEKIWDNNGICPDAEPKEQEDQG